jgi:hypothetical protein
MFRVVVLRDLDRGVAEKFQIRARSLPLLLIFYQIY